MPVFNNNEMFILALVSLSIVGLICVGLLIILAVFVLRQRRVGQPINSSPNDENPLPKDTPPLPTDEIKKEIEKSRISIWLTPVAFGGSITLFGLSYLARLTTDKISIWLNAIIIASAGLGFMFWAIHKAKAAERKYRRNWNEPPNP